MEIHHLSPSAIQEFNDCPFKWYGKRWGGLMEPPTLGQQRGSAIDRALGAYHQGEDAELVLVRSWRALVTLPAPSDALGQALKLIEVYAAAVRPEPNDWVQYRVEVPIPGLPIPLLGFIDLGRGPDCRQLWDWKTTMGTYWDQAHTDESIQATAYWWAIWSGLDHRDQPDGFTFQVLNLREISLTSICTERKEEELEAFEDGLRATYGAMVAALAAPEGLGHSCSFCPWPKRCGREAPKLLVVGSGAQSF